MRQIRHPNILPALSSFVSNSDICIVTPIMKMGSARDVLNSHFPEGKIVLSLWALFQQEEPTPSGLVNYYFQPYYIKAFYSYRFA